MADAIVERLKKSGGEPDRTEILTNLKFEFPQGDETRIHTRLTALFHGHVGIAGFDLLERLNAGRRALERGPYEVAEEALETVLEVFPDHPEAKRLMVQTADLLEHGDEPGQISVKVDFDSGMPKEEQKKLWKETHSGFYSLERLDKRRSPTLRNGALTGTGFTAHLPRGRYRLRVVLPGFKSVNQEVKVEARSELSLKLKH